MNGGEIIGLVTVICIFGATVSGIWASHRRKALELQLRLRGEGSGNVRAEMEALQQEMRTLRDTTMQYDLSFDTALQRIEQRVENIERRAISPEERNMAELSSGR